MDKMKKILFIAFSFLWISSYAQKLSELPVTTTIGSPDWLIALKVGATTGNRITVDSFRNYIFNSSGTGIIPILNGGTGSSTANGALNNLLPSQVGNANKFLQTDGTNATWVSSNAGVTSVSATSPLASSGGATPTITITQSGVGTNGYLSTTDWNTFNNKPSTLAQVLANGRNADPSGGSGGYIKTSAGIDAISINSNYLLKANSSVSLDWQSLQLSGGDWNTTGSLGVHKTSPTERLDVDGNIRFSGALMPNNTAGTSGQVLTSAGAGLVPTWTTPTTGTVTNIATGTGLTGGPITSTGTISVSTIPVANGGTNITSYAVGDLLYASGATTLSKLAGVATGNALISGGVTTAPSWGKIDLTSHVTGITPIANGGTNTSTAASAGSVIYSTSTAYAMTAVGSPGQLLQSNAATAPTFVSNISPTSITTNSLTITSSGIINPIGLTINNTGDNSTTINSTGALITTEGAFTGTGIDVSASCINGGVANAGTFSSVGANSLGYNNGIGVFASGGLYNTTASFMASGGTTAKGLYISCSGATNNHAIIVGSGLVGLGTASPSTSLDVNGGLVLEPLTTQTLTAASTTVTVGNSSYIRISSDNATAANRLLVLPQSTYAGQLLTIEFVGATNKCEIVDDAAQGTAGNMRLASTFDMDQYDIIRFISNGTDWIEIARSVN